MTVVDGACNLLAFIRRGVLSSDLYHDDMSGIGRYSAAAAASSRYGVHFRQGDQRQQGTAEMYTAMDVIPALHRIYSMATNDCPFSHVDTVRTLSTAAAGGGGGQ